MNNARRALNYYKKLDRKDFMQEDYKDQVSIDSPFPIGYGQTISQPSLILKMTQMLDIDKESRVLEIGTGSGYQTALLSSLAKEVYTVERIFELYGQARIRLGALGYNNIHFKLADDKLGWPDEGPYDRIMVTAAAYTIEEDLIGQLKVGGKMVIPVGGDFYQDLLLVEKKTEEELVSKQMGLVRFVRLI